MTDDHDLSGAALKMIEEAGFALHITGSFVEARNPENGERFIVKYDGNFYVPVVELARQIGLELEDG